MALGLALFMLNRSTSTYLALDMFVALLGLVAILVPITNMLAISLPREAVAVGLGMNTMLRNLGGAIGPVLATTIMASYTVSVTLPNHVVSRVSHLYGVYYYFLGRDCIGFDCLGTKSRDEKLYVPQGAAKAAIV